MYYKLLKTLYAPFVRVYNWVADKDTEETIWLGMIGGFFLTLVLWFSCAYMPLNTLEHVCRLIGVIFASAVVSVLLASMLAGPVRILIAAFTKEFRDECMMIDAKERYKEYKKKH